jgi:hypothetical protein
VLDGSRAPEEAMLRFDATQQAGDCCIELEDDAAALDWYSEGLELARQIDDPFEVTVQLGKMAVALTNLKRHDEALSHYAQARELLVRIGEEEDLQHKIKVHSNLFNVERCPGSSPTTMSARPTRRRRLGATFCATCRRSSRRVRRPSRPAAPSPRRRAG